jgi:hypothetical protein
MKTYSFTTEILGNNLGGAGIQFPYNVQEEFGVKGRVKVHVTFDGIAYRGSLAPMHGGHMLVLRKEIRKQIGKDVGDYVDVVLKQDTELREIVVPADLQAALAANPKAEAAFAAFAYTHRKEYVNWVNLAKKQITRESRIQKTVERVANNQPFS